MTNVIKLLRLRKGMTQEELSVKLGVTKHSVQKYESGAIVNLKASTIRTLCDLFEVPPICFVYDLPELKQMDIDALLTPTYNGKWFTDVCYRNLGIKISKLNKKGVRKLDDYIDDLLKINEYKGDENE